MSALNDDLVDIDEEIEQQQGFVAPPQNVSQAHLINTLRSNAPVPGGRRRRRRRRRSSKRRKSRKSKRKRRKKRRRTKKKRRRRR